MSDNGLKRENVNAPPLLAFERFSFRNEATCPYQSIRLGATMIAICGYFSPNLAQFGLP